MRLFVQGKRKETTASMRRRIAQFLNRWDRLEELTETDKAAFLGDAVELLRDCLDVLVEIA